MNLAEKEVAPVTYPFVKVTVREPFGHASHTDVEGSPVVARLIAHRWTLVRRWEVLGPGFARELALAPTEIHAPRKDNT